MMARFCASRKRCCPQCQKRTLTVQDKEVVEYYHRGVVCHLIGHDLAVPLDVELLRPGEGEETAAKRLLERVFANHDATAITNFTLTLFIVFVLLQSFWLRNLKPAKRVLLTLIALARELDRGLAGCRAPWHRQLARGP